MLHIAVYFLFLQFARNSRYPCAKVEVLSSGSVSGFSGEATPSTNFQVAGTDISCHYLHKVAF